MPVYSIILPVYNVAEYLAECLDSILAQDTASPYEVILVDDGSTDGSGAICDEYAGRYGSFSVVHIPNGGVSNARNTGLSRARGDYVLFIDPDDLCRPDMLSTLDSLRGNTPDMMVFAAESFNERGVLERIASAVLPDGESGPAYLERVFQIQCLPPVAVWNYVYRREFLLGHGLSFRTDLVVAEDLDFNFGCLSHAEKICGSEKVLYCYRVRETSASHHPNPKKIYQKITVYSECFRRHPVSVLANSYCYLAFSLSQLGTKAELSELLQHYRENADILMAASSPKCKFARLLFRLFGLYYGSAIIMAMIRAEHRMRGIS